MTFQTLSKLIEESPLPWPPEFAEEVKTYNSENIVMANNVFARQMVVVLVTYTEAIINEFLECIFIEHPQRMYEYLAAKGDENVQKGKVDLKEIIKAASKDDLLKSLANIATANATKGNFNSTIKILEQEAKSKFDIELLSEIRLLVESRNRIVHEASIEVITALQIRESVKLIENFLRSLGVMAETNGIVVNDMFRELDKIKWSPKEND